MQSEEQLIAASIRDTINEADRAVQKYWHLSEMNTYDDVKDDRVRDELLMAQERIAFLVERVFRETAILAERLGLPKYRRDIMRKMRAFKDLAQTEIASEDYTFHSAPLSDARTMFDSLAVMTNGRAVTGLGVFENILASTPKIVASGRLIPSNEAQVRNAVRKVLGFAFPDVVREVPIPKNLKTYKPDIGVRSLLAAAEYKYIDSKSEAKSALDGIYADMRGYSGSHEWRSFYAVLYLTGPFYTQKDVEAEFELVKADLSWKPLVVFGDGRRTSKA
jgi:hypothetical protein